MKLALLIINEQNAVFEKDYTRYSSRQECRSSNSSLNRKVKYQFFNQIFNNRFGPILSFENTLEILHQS